jgi:hypothetical protein
LAANARRLIDDPPAVNLKPGALPMLKRLLLLLAIAAVGSVCRATADEEGWRWRSRTIEATGHYYVAESEPTGRSDGRRAFTLAERRPGSAPVSSMEDFSENFGFCRSVANQAEFFGVRKGDIVHGRVVLPRRPDAVAISSAGLGFAALGVATWTNEGERIPPDADIVVIVSKGGEILHRKKFDDLFTDEEIKGFERQATIQHQHVLSLWLRGGWIDDAAEKLVIVCNSPETPSGKPMMRLIDLNSGERSSGSPELALTAVVEMNRVALEPALAVAAEWKLAGLQPVALRVLEDEDLPVRTRLCAAGALAAIGDPSGVQLVTDTIRLRKEKRRLDVMLAVSCAPRVLGTAAIPLLKELAADGWDNGIGLVPRALADIGPAVVPSLIEMLADAKNHPIRQVALQAISRLGPMAKQAVPALTVALRGADLAKDWSMGSGIARALAHIGPDAKAAVPALKHFAIGCCAHLRRLEARGPASSSDLRVDWARADYDAVVDALAKISR